MVMVSGGADSVALLIGLTEVLEPGRLAVLHVNYGLRDEAGEDEELVRNLCARLDVECQVVRAGSPEGNLQAWAREIRHREAEALRESRNMDWVAIGHNRSDLAETFLYRLATSPGGRSLLAMPAQSGPIIRPLLALGRDEIRTMLDGAADWAEDRTNLDPWYARNRIRLEVIPQLEELNPAAQVNIARTRAELEEDDLALSEMAITALRSEGEDIAEGVPSRAFAGHDPAVARRMLRFLAESALGRPVAITPETTRRFIRLSRSSEMSSLDLGSGAVLRIESGMVVVLPRGGETVEPIRLGEGDNRFGRWAIQADPIGPRQARSEFGEKWSAFFDLPGADFGLTVRAREEGDRIGQLGMSGSKSLQDLFTDAGIPASRRDGWPVLVLDSKVLWVPGLARSRDFLVVGGDRPVLRLQARPPFDP